MPLTIAKRDLFEQKDALAHCVSVDLKMGKGIAVEFKKRFGRVGDLLAQDKQVGEVAYLVDEASRPIFYLITKQHYYGKPTYETLTSSLKEMYRLCKIFEINSVSMPRIGCGLDRLEWPKVQQIIEEIFIDIQVTVCVID